jgi:hypothetical protein
MKKKINKGVEYLTALCKKENLSEQIKPLIYSFRSYGYFCQHKFSNAINDLKTITKLGYQLDKTCEYNMTLLKGILSAQNNQFDEALSTFK